MIFRSVIMVAFIIFAGFAFSVILLRVVLYFLMKEFTPYREVLQTSRKSKITSAIRSFLRRCGFRVRENNVLPYLTAEDTSDAGKNEDKITRNSHQINLS